MSQGRSEPRRGGGCFGIGILVVLTLAGAGISAFYLMAFAFTGRFEGLVPPVAIWALLTFAYKWYADSRRRDRTASDRSGFGRVDDHEYE